VSSVVNGLPFKMAQAPPLGSPGRSVTASKPWRMLAVLERKSV